MWIKKNIKTHSFLFNFHVKQLLLELILHCFPSYSQHWRFFFLCVCVCVCVKVSFHLLQVLFQTGFTVLATASLFLSTLHTHVLLVYSRVSIIKWTWASISGSLSFSGFSLFSVIWVSSHWSVVWRASPTQGQNANWVFSDMPKHAPEVRCMWAGSHTTCSEP